MNLNQITVPLFDLSIAIPFYEKLGLRLIVNTSDCYACFECTDGDSIFSIQKTEKLSVGRGVVVYLEEENLDDKVKQLRELGIAVDLLPTNWPWLWRESNLSDPDDNHIVLYSAGENCFDPPWELKQRSDAFYEQEVFIYSYVFLEKLNFISVYCI